MRRLLFLATTIGLFFAGSPALADPVCALVCPPECTLKLTETSCSCNCPLSGPPPAPAARAATLLPDLDLRLSFPKDIYVNEMPMIPGNDRRVMATAAVTLTNRSRSPVDLVASTSCEVHDWTLVDETGRVVQTELDDVCIDVVQFLSLKPGDEVSGSHQVVLDGRLLEDGRTYTLNYAYWHVQGFTRFTAHIVH